MTRIRIGTCREKIRSGSNHRKIARIRPEKNITLRDTRGYVNFVIYGSIIFFILYILVTYLNTSVIVLGNLRTYLQVYGLTYRFTDSLTGLRSYLKGLWTYLQVYVLTCRFMDLLTGIRPNLAYGFTYILKDLLTGLLTCFHTEKVIFRRASPYAYLA